LLENAGFPNGITKEQLTMMLCPGIEEMNDETWTQVLARCDEEHLKVVDLGLMSDGTRNRSQCDRE
jgi:hypothetical protein